MEGQCLGFSVNTRIYFKSETSNPNSATQIHSCRLVIVSCCGTPTDKTGGYLGVPSSKGGIRWVKVCILFV